MRSLWFIRPGHCEWRDVPPPRLGGEHEALVEPIAASTCDIDRLLIEGRPPFQPGSVFDSPFPIGHEGVGRVLQVGNSVRSVREGELVAIAWRPHCDSCRYCARGLTAYCERFPRGTSYGLPTGAPWGALFDDIVRVPYADAMLTPLPRGVAPLQAVTAADNASLGRALVETHMAEGREHLLVLGWGAAGLYAVAFARLFGATHLVYVDESDDNGRIARALGANAVAASPTRGLGPFDLVVDAALRPDWLRQSIGLLEPEGAIECLAHFTDFTLPGHALYATGVSFHCSVCSNGPHVAPTLASIAEGALSASQVWTREVDWEDLPAAMASPGLKLVGVKPAARTEGDRRRPWRQDARIPETGT